MALLQHIGNIKSSMLLAQAAKLKENRVIMKLLLDPVLQHNILGKICGDLKVISLTLKLQLGYRKHICISFLYM